MSCSRAPCRTCEIHYVVDENGHDNLPRPLTDPNEPPEPLDYLIANLSIPKARLRYENRAQQIDINLPLDSVDINGSELTDRHRVRLDAVAGQVQIKGRAASVDRLSGEIDLGKDDLKVERTADGGARLARESRGIDSPVRRAGDRAVAQGRRRRGRHCAAARREGRGRRPNRHRRDRAGTAGVAGGRCSRQRHGAAVPNGGRRAARRHGRVRSGQPACRSVVRAHAGALGQRGSKRRARARSGEHVARRRHPRRRRCRHPDARLRAAVCRGDARRWLAARDVAGARLHEVRGRGGGDADTDRSDGGAIDDPGRRARLLPRHRPVDRRPAPAGDGRRRAGVGRRRHRRPAPASRRAPHERRRYHTDDERGGGVSRARTRLAAADAGRRRRGRADAARRYARRAVRGVADQRVRRSPSATRRASPWTPTCGTRRTRSPSLERTWAGSRRTPR